MLMESIIFKPMDLRIVRNIDSWRFIAIGLRAIFSNIDHIVILSVVPMEVLQDGGKIFGLPQIQHILLLPMVTACP